MSRDIRSFFISKKPLNPKDDEDVIPDSPDVQIKNKKKESRKRRVLLDDSDEEISPSKKKASSKEKNKHSSKSQVKSPQKNTLKEVKAADLFGGPIKRTEPLVTKTKAKKKNTEVNIHSDDEFETSLLQLDVIDDLQKRELPNTTNGHMTNNVDKIETKKIENKATLNGFKRSKHKEIESEPKGINNSFKHESPSTQEKDIKLEKVSPEKIDKKPHKIKVSENENLTKRIKSETSVDEVDKKRKFSEFIDGDVDSINANNDNKHSDKKRKLNKSLNGSVLTDEERHERRMHSAALYQRYLNRSGPKHLGSKEIPEGAPNCLKDCAFLLTGVLDSFEREEVVAAINKYGGCVKNSVSKKVTHVLAGDDAGPAKLAKAQDLGIKIINEDEFLKMIKDSSDNKMITDCNLDVKNKHTSNKKTPEPKKSTKDKKPRSNNDIKAETDEVIVVEEEFSKKKSKLTNGHVKEIRDNKSNIKISETKISQKETVKMEMKDKLESEHEIEDNKSHGQSETNEKQVTLVESEISTSLMWVDKHKPQSLKYIIGQHGEASNVKKLLNWLTKWYVNRKAKLPKPSPWAKNDDGGYFKAALLSGPPGVGKTTTVSLVCKELGFDMVEFNASDTRSKTLIREQITELLTTNSLSAYAKGNTGKQAVTKKHVLVMDEVDGMAGNEDRGGLQELIALIRTTSVPIICMCNDRSSQKMRSLVNYCYDLRFSRPRVDQIKGAMMRICCQEGVKIPPSVLTQLIAAAGQDVRQTLHMLNMWAVGDRLQQPDSAAAATRVNKDVKMGPWDAIRKVFSAEDHKTMSLNDKSDLFFCDYSLAPLFVQENYLSVVPHCNKNEVLDRMSKAADSISLGDLVDARIRGSQAWNLLPIQAMYSSVIPGHHLSGHVGGQIQFPGWLGKNSRANKMHRLAQEIHAHTRLSTSGSKSSIFLDYAPHLRDAVLNPLIQDKSDGIGRSLEVLESYRLLREDLDSLTELSLWPGQRNPNVLVDAKVKAAMTRTYNKQASALPYAPGAVKKGRSREDDDSEEQDYQDAEEEGNDDNPENDALIKKKKSNTMDKAGPSNGKAGSSNRKAGSNNGKAGSSNGKAGSSNGKAGSSNGKEKKKK